MKEVISNQKDEAEKKEAYWKNLGHKLFYEFHNEPINLTREERKRLRESKDPKDQELADQYKKSKYRNNYFASVRIYLDTVLDQGQFQVPNREELIKKREQLFEDFENLDTFYGNPITPEMVKRSDDLLKEVLDIKE